MKNLKFIIYNALLISTLTACGQTKNSALETAAVLEDKKGKFPIEKTESEWRTLLGPAAFEVMVKEGTEPPFKNEYYNNHKKVFM